ncbi:MAG: hypothetical protein AAGA23_18255 [Pseudomonadota bacterium]
MPKSARERLAQEKVPKKVVLDKDFAGIRAGQRMFVGTPQIVANYLNKIPAGQARTIPRLRNELARRHRCDAMCPVSTAIFIRIAAEAAIEEMEDGAEPSAVTPFWRLLTPTDKISKKLPIDSVWIAHQREREGLVEPAG